MGKKKKKFKKDEFLIYHKKSEKKKKSDKDEFLIYHKKSEKKKKSDNDKYDYSDIDCDEDKIREDMKKMGDGLERFADYLEGYTIFHGISEKEWEENVNTVKKLAKKLKKMNPSVFNVDELNYILKHNHSLVTGLGNDYYREEDDY